MRKSKLLFTLVIVLFFTQRIESQVSAVGHVTAEVIPMFSATETAQLNFGRFSPGPQGGEIILTPESTISVMGSVFTGTGLHNAASFYISGDNDASYTITLPSGPVVLKHVSNSKTLVVKNLLSNPGTGTGAGILKNGSQIVYVGAILKVGTLEDNPVGIYAGTYTITFDFN